MRRNQLAPVLLLAVCAACSNGGDVNSTVPTVPEGAATSTSVLATSLPTASSVEPSTSAVPSSTLAPVAWQPAPTAPAGLHLTVSEFDRVRVHTLVAPAELTANSAHVVETADHVLIVDAGNSRDTAEAFRTYVDAIGKPIERVVLSHGHPDHWFGVALAFPHDLIWADARTIERIAERGNGDIQRLSAFFPADQIPSEPVVITNTLEAGTIDLDGVLLDVDVVETAEAPSQVVISIPEAKVLIAQDLVYSDGHLFTGNGSFQEWISVLESFAATTDDEWIVLAGHGMPTTRAIFAAEIDYLNAAEGAHMSATSAAEYVEAMTELYPDMADPLILQFAANQLFSEGGFATTTTGA